MSRRSGWPGCHDVSSLPVPDELLARCTFPPAGSEVVCGVSGGADSTALLVLAVASGCHATAIHVDHGLRLASASEADRVEAVARSLGAGFDSRTAKVEPGPNLEERARIARAAALPTDVLLGHTADDQAQTVLWHLARGAGSHGLGAMSPDRRPILGLRRSETHELCERLGLDVVVDPSNDDPSITRNRIRAELVPLLCDIAGRDVVPILCRAASHQREIAGLLDDLAAGIDADDARSLADAPAAVAATIVRSAWRRHAGDGHGPDAAAIGRVLDVAAGRTLATDVVDGWRVERHAGKLMWLRTIG